MAKNEETTSQYSVALWQPSVTYDLYAPSGYPRAPCLARISAVLLRLQIAKNEEPTTQYSVALWQPSVTYDLRAILARRRIFLSFVLLFKEHYCLDSKAVAIYNKQKAHDAVVGFSFISLPAKPSARKRPQGSRRKFCPLVPSS